MITAEIHRLAESHDKPGVDGLLITAGAPDRNGNIFPSEEAVARFIVENNLGLEKQLKHIRWVWLHSWAAGCGTMLYPNRLNMFGPMYASLEPSHHPLEVYRQWLKMQSEQSLTGQSEAETPVP
jgi:hypothetical protein